MVSIFSCIFWPFEFLLLRNNRTGSSVVFSREKIEFESEFCDKHRVWVLSALLQEFKIVEWMCKQTNIWTLRWVLKLAFKNGLSNTSLNEKAGTHSYFTGRKTDGHNNSKSLISSSSAMWSRGVQPSQHFCSYSVSWEQVQPSEPSYNGVKLITSLHLTFLEFYDNWMSSWMRNVLQHKKCQRLKVLL
jgi:hypothetical protein